MAFGTASAVFGAFIQQSFQASNALDIDSHTLKVALYNNTGTPDRSVALALTAYNGATSQWVIANEVSDTGGWAAGGLALTSPTSGFTGTSASGVYMFDAADRATTASLTSGLSNAYGCLIYDTQSTPTVNQGVCFNAFGGAVSAPAGGTLTIQWNAGGIFTIGF